MDVAQLIELRKQWVSPAAMASTMNVNRATIWRREEKADPSDAVFWKRYAAALRSHISPKAQEALKALDQVSEATVGAAA